MNGVLNNLLNGVVEIWKNIGVSQKVSIVLVGMLALGATALIIFFGSQPNWGVLYSNLDSETSAKVYDIVSAAGVPVKLGEAGRSIMVPSNKVYELRMRVASEGVSVEKTGIGLELFDNIKLGMTDKQQQVAFQRALQGELERMIASMPGVVSSRVMLNMPQRQMFRRDGGQPSASIMVLLDRGARLAPRQVESIRYIVAGAVEGLTPQDINISDNHGNLLVRQEDDSLTGSMASSNRNLEIQATMERQTREKAESILRPIVGAQNVVAVVSCDIDFDRIDRVMENYNAEGAVVISERVVKEDSSRQAQNESGRVGAAANLVAVAQPEAGAGNETVASDIRQTSERRMVVPKTIETVSVAGARLRNMAVAVTIGKKPDGSAWSVDDMSRFRSLVAAAVGADTLTNTPRITVEEMEFAPIPAPPTMSPPIFDTLVFNFEKITNSPFVRPLIGLAMLAFLYKLFRKHFDKGSIEGSEMPAGLYGEHIRPIGRNNDEEQIDLVETALNQIPDRTSAVSPEALAQVMEGWLKSETSL